MNLNDQKQWQHGRERGVALITALLILSLFTVMTLSMVIATMSDTLIDGYYRNARASFYAADSGMNVARQYLMAQFAAAVPNPYTAYSTTPPVATGTETTILSGLVNTSSGFGAYKSILGSQASWTGQFKVDSTNSTLSAPTCTIHYTSSTGTIPTCTNAGNGSATYYAYSYPYTLTVIGQSNANETNTIRESGTIVLTATIHSTSSTNTNFAAWGMFIDQSPICNGSYLVPGTITGPVFTNGAWNFGTSGSYIFTDEVGSASANLGYQFSSCYQSSNSSYTSGSQTIHPTFQSGIALNQPNIPLPTDSFNQKEAVLDGIGNGGSPSMQAILKDVNGNPYPATAPSSGVYLPYYSNSGTLTFGSSGTPPGCGGGIYVEGAASVAVSAGTVTGTSSPQIYTITQGSAVTTVTVDNLANTTKIVKGGTSKTITGVPTQCNSSSTFQRDATMLYVDGNITGLQGGGQGVGSIQNTTALDIVANGSITITGDLLYQSEPVTLTQSGSTPADTLIAANNHGQTLGIFTANGNINLNNSQSNGNLEIDASIAALSAGGSGGLTNTGSNINTLTIVGGRMQNTIQNIGATTRNVWFDRRYAQGGFSPPWFPSTTVTSSTTYTTPVPVVSANRISWVNTTAE
ncbi:MAG TPA: pilus assembly PilX N-terminal domain-containing protein [Candidatus Acidoferrales bacterium]|nr:pilus assembly PilX N-terminal domain-containing protein [Candidatus Acidoferrales bacterium]